MDIRFRARADLDASDLLGLRDVFAEAFPTSEVMHQIGTTIRIEKSVARTETEKPRQIGVIFKSSDEKLIFQARVDGITLSRLPPYRSFDELEPLLNSCWGAYVRVARPVQATRIAVRYINRFDIPVDADLADWLVAPPKPVLPKVLLDAFVHRDLWRTDNGQYAVNLVTALEPGLDGRTSQVIIDIDAFSESHAVALESSDSDGSLTTIRGRFAELRFLKNQFFFSLLTPRCIQTFR